MKKWLPLLILSLMLTGCGGNKDDQAKSDTKAKTNNESKAKTQNKQDNKSGNKQGNKQENKAKTLALKNMDKNKRDVVLFLNRAESLAQQLQFEAANLTNGKAVTEDGLTYRQLPEKYDTRDEILDYFSRFWSRPLAENLYDYMNTKLVNGKVYLAPDDSEYPMIISNRNTFVKYDDGDLIATVNEITLPAYAQDRTVTYRLSRDKKTKLYEIKKREGTYGSEMYK
ncbi:hypothetical protein [Brevibacillus migulae]|uniref:hypothetical protein n=1 Tax=Brevibacillus migulae TaxID=1644114 RepID=UPI001F48DC5C|nr:hypothetical protein [Brevibacillus migulae]